MATADVERRGSLTARGFSREGSIAGALCALIAT
jgi:hypothetical protein